VGEKKMADEQMANAIENLANSLEGVTRVLYGNRTSRNAIEKLADGLEHFTTTPLEQSYNIQCTGADPDMHPLPVVNARVESYTVKCPRFEYETGMCLDRGKKGGYKAQIVRECPYK